MGDAVSHAILPGLAIAYMTGIPLAIGAFIGGLFCAVATGHIKNSCRVKEDAVMGIIFSGMFAFGLVLITRIESDIHLMHVLFGNVLGISHSDMVEAGTIAILCSLIMLIKRKDFMLYCFDAGQANAIGLPVKLLNYSLLILLSLTIVSSLKAAGIILVIAMLIAPGATAFLITKSFDHMLIIALCVSLISCITGVFFSYHADVSTAPLIVLIQSLMFLCALIRSIMHQEKIKTTANQKDGTLL